MVNQSAEFAEFECLLHQCACCQYLRDQTFCYLGNNQINYKSIITNKHPLVFLFVILVALASLN